MPPFCQFQFFRLQHENERDHASLELVGLESCGSWQGLEGQYPGFPISIAVPKMNLEMEQRSSPFDP